MSNMTPSPESAVMTTSGSRSLLSDNFVIPGSGAEHGGTWNSRHLYIDIGQIHVSFTSAGGPVDFLVLTGKQWSNWREISLKPQADDEIFRVPCLGSRFGASSFESTMNIPSDGLYFFVFLNRNEKAVSINLNVGALCQAETHGYSR